MVKRPASYPFLILLPTSPGKLTVVSVEVGWLFRMDSSLLILIDDDHCISTSVPN